MYNVYKDKLRESIRVNNEAKESFEVKLADNIKQDSKSFYAYVRSKQRCKETVGPFTDNNGKIVSDNKVGANLLNDYFVSVFTTEDLNTIPEPENIFTRSINEEGLSTIIISEEIVCKKLGAINSNKSPGVDDLHPKLLYELRNELSKPLAKLYNLSLELGEIPHDWRDANVTPLF
jgi:hypothetical protein